MCFRRADLERVGGLESMRDVLAEDYALGLAFARLGMRVSTSPELIQTVNATWSVERFLARHLRWGQIRRRIAPVAFFGEPLMNPVAWGLGCALAGAPLVGVAAIGSKLLTDALLVRRLTGRFPSLAELAWIVPKDLAMLGVWAIAAFKREVVWRGQRYRIRAGTRLTPCPGGARELDPAA